MYQISKEAFKKCSIEVIDGIDNKYIWINRKDLEVESDYSNLAKIFDKCDLKKQNYRQE